MHYSHIVMGAVVISAISTRGMTVEKKKPRKTVQVLSAPVACDRPSLQMRQLQNDRVELVAAFFEKIDPLSLLRPRL